MKPPCQPVRVALALHARISADREFYRISLDLRLMRSESSLLNLRLRHPGLRRGVERSRHKWRQRTREGPEARFGILTEKPDQGRRFHMLFYHIFASSSCNAASRMIVR